VTIRQLLHHTGGWDRNRSFDPMFGPLIIAKALGTAPPAEPREIIRYMLGQPLDFDPGTQYAYSNFGYCVLGRVIEKVSGQSYEAYVKAQVLAPLGMHDTQLGQTLHAAKGEVRYVDDKGRTANAVVGPDLGKPVPLPYGAWYLEAMDAHGGWISSAPDLVRFASACAHAERSPLLKPASVQTLFARPDGLAGQTKAGKAKDVFYGCGWQVRTVDKSGAINFWHTGALDGTSTLLVHRSDDLCWAVLFNTRADGGPDLAGLIDPLVHQAANQVRRWPARDLFKEK
jgi:N-acyl-D-amino-acid deacylase